MPSNCYNGCRTDKLKRLMQMRFPQLLYDQPPQLNKSELVYSKDAKLTKLTSINDRDSDSNSDSLEHFDSDSVALANSTGGPIDLYLSICVGRNCLILLNCILTVCNCR